jgi:hypothetical protein
MATNMNQLYTSLSPAIREELSKYEEHVTVPAGTALISEGVASQYVILIERGLAEISVPAGDTVVSLSVAGEGRVLGLRSVVAGVLPEIEATALEDCASGCRINFCTRQFDVSAENRYVTRRDRSILCSAGFGWLDLGCFVRNFVSVG